jgi:hypothetical protein
VTLVEKQSREEKDEEETRRAKARLRVERVQCQQDMRFRLSFAGLEQVRNGSA